MTFKILATLLLVFIFLLGCGRTGPVSNVETAEGGEQPTGELIFREDEELQKEIAAIANEAKGKVGVFALLLEENRAVSLNGKERFAMQSVVKLPVAMAVMKQVGEGKLAIDQKVNFTAEDLVSPNQRSPLRDKNPNGGSAAVEDLIRLAVSESDGSACDILTRVAGGTGALQQFVVSLGINEMAINRTHKEFGKSWELQYENWATPEAAVELLESLWNQANPTPPEPDNLELKLLQFMYDTPTGPNRIKGLLPPNTPVAHKTGTGGMREGVTSATNDVGVITLPNRKHVAIAVFVGDSLADEKTREGVIAKVAKAVWDKWSG